MSDFVSFYFLILYTYLLGFVIIIRLLQLFQTCSRFFKKKNGQTLGIPEYKSSIVRKYLLGERYLPKDVLMDIFSSLSLKTLDRARNVNKSWKRFIESPEFVYFHLKKSISEKNFSFVSVEHLTDISGRTHLFSRSMDNLNKKATTPLPIKGKFHMVSSMNGLFFMELDESYLLFNPLRLTQYKLIIGCDVQGPQGSNFVNKIVISGCCFISETFEYKIVRIVKGINYEKMCTSYEVFSFSIETWRKLDYVSEIEVMKDRTVQFKGFFHFKGKKGKDGMILRFDIKNECFDEMSLPKRLTLSEAQLHVWKGHLSVIHRRFLDDGTCLDIWTMESYGDDESWEMRMVVSPMVGDFSCAGVGKNSEFLLRHHLEFFVDEAIEDHLSLYDPEQGRITVGPYACALWKYEAHDVYSYVGSLVALKEKETLISHILSLFVPFFWVLPFIQLIVSLITLWRIFRYSSWWNGK